MEDDLQEASSSDVRFLARGMDVESSDDIDKDGAIWVVVVLTGSTDHTERLVGCKKYWTVV